MKSISLYVDKDTYLTRMHPYETVLYPDSGRCIADRREVMGIRYIHWNQSCNAYQWKNHEKGFSTDCFFIYNSDHHIFDPWFI